MSNTVVFKDRELSEVTVIENEFIKSFLADMPALPLKVYIYGLMLLSGASSADADLASALGCGDNDLRAAVSYLEGVGLVKVIADEPLQLKFNSAKEACGGNFAVGDTAYADLVNGIQKVAGTRIITGREIKKIYDWVEIFGFEKEAAVEIVRRCLDKKGARTSVNYMDSVAKDLAAAGALTREQVLERFADEDSLSNGVMELQRQMNRRGLPTKDEEALYEKWTKAWGFTQDVIFAACA
ncbi:MAG: DnaD domain protein [Clostridia bacterium]|nr:DnaD domain protein [Clostridia bacterium]